MAITVAHLQALVTADTGEAERKLTTFSKKLEGMSKVASQVGMSMTMFVTAPMIAAGGAAVMMASDYEESLNKVRVVFGEASGAIEEFANAAAGNLRMSSGEAMAAAGTFGNLFVSMGSTQENAAEMSQTLLQLGADLSSFNNIPAGEALQKLQSAMVGSYEPLESLGAKLSQAKVEAKALALGIWDGAGAMDDATLIAARYALIMEKTVTAQGDAAKTSGEFAGQMAELKAQWGDLAISLGSALLPSAEGLATALTDLLEKFNNLSPGAQEAIIKFGLLVAAIGPVLWILGTLGKVVLFVAGLFGTGGALSAAFTAISTFVSLYLIPVFASLGGILAAISLPVWILIAAIGALVAVIAICGKDAAKTFTMLAQIVGAVFKRMLDDIINWGAQILEYIKGLALNLAKNAKNWFQTVGKALVNGIWQGIQSGWSWLIDKVTALAKDLLKAAQAALGISSPSQVFALEVGRPIAEGIGLGFTEAMSGIGRNMANLIQPQSLQPVGAGAGAGGGALEMGGMRSRQPVNLTVNIGGRELRKVVIDAINQELTI